MAGASLWVHMGQGAVLWVEGLQTAHLLLQFGHGLGAGDDLLLLDVVLGSKCLGKTQNKSRKRVAQGLWGQPIYILPLDLKQLNETTTEMLQTPSPQWAPP